MRMVVMVAAHKPYWMPEDAAYWPVLVGAAGKEAPPGWRRDDAGENISARNATFCELTGHYWLWKNVEADVYGLCHYRRYFARGLPVGDKRRRIMPAERLDRLMSGCAVLLPRKRHYWIETNYSQYAHAHHAEDLRAARRVIEQRHPAYLPAWERVMRRRSGHRFNMFLMRREAFLAYSAWLFDILFELERRLDITGYSANDRRVFGFVGERLLDVWLEHERPACRECRVINLEPQHWGKKIFRFLQRKFRGRGDESKERR